MAEGVPTNNQRGRRSGPCRLWGGLDNQYTECSRKLNNKFIEVKIEKSRIFLRSKYLGIDLTLEGEKPWATKDIFINYVVIGNDSFQTIIRFTLSCHQLSSYVFISHNLKSLGTLKGRNSCQHICPSEASKVQYRVIRLFLNGLKWSWYLWNQKDIFWMFIPKSVFDYRHNNFLNHQICQTAYFGAMRKMSTSWRYLHVFHCASHAKFNMH